MFPSGNRPSLLRSWLPRIEFPATHVILRSILRRALALGMKGLKKTNQRRHLGRGKILPISGHVSPALQHLAHQLVISKPRSHTVERRPALPPRPPIM